MMDRARLDSILARVSKPSRYLGNEINVIHKDFDAATVRVALIFPDKYEIGMSHVGLKILYEILNRLPDVVAERCFAPDLDMEAALRKEGLPLFSMESKRPLKDFDLIGFSLTYELTYTNMLAILDLAGIPLWQKDRGTSDPLIIAGGGCTMNAEPVADFLDAAVLGDGEEIILDLVDVLRKRKGELHSTLLNAFSEIEGIYVPSFFQPEYHPDGTIKEMKPLKEGYTKINKRVVQNIDKAVYPTATLVPSIKIVHERIGIEIQRGCNRACRFCQAGYIDRPVRQRSPETILNIAEKALQETGIGEISLLSLSAADYACIVPLTAELNRRYSDDKVSISVPATRTEKLTPELIEQIKKVRKTGFTIAPEAGSARMRRVINKGNKVDDLYRAVTNAFSAGWELLKLYYMVGLPFETDEDVLGIAEEGNGAMEICRKYTSRADLNLSVSSFVPKPFTPFQWEPQMTVDETWRKYHLVKMSLRNRRIRFKHHHAQMSYVEGLLSRGDRRVAQALYLAFMEGCRFDEWEEHFDFSKWEKAFAKWEGDVAFYLHRRREKEEVLPWDHLFAQMDKNFLWEELERAHDAAVEETRSVQHGLKPLPGQLPGFTEDCSVQRCSNCGVCDYRQIKNRIFVPGSESMMEKKGHREWYGWTASPVVGAIHESPHPQAPLAPMHLRFRFSKTGDARFMGHLELMDVLKRTLGRLKIPVAFSQGFHPQMKISMGYALPLGIESDWEFFDLELKEPLSTQFLMDYLNKALPGGVQILHACAIDRSAPSLYSSLASVSYQATIPGNGWADKMEQGLARFREADELTWVREKSGKVKSFNLKKVVSLVQEDFPTFSFKTKIDPEGSLGPQDVLSALLGVNQEELSRIGLKKIGVAWREL